ncbi:MAG: hypothetical protein JJU13_08295 [Balneolaceae bacterium]|nr:hypothetical protein [Balneolaceae bacterium]
MSQILFDKIAEAIIPRGENQERIDEVEEALLKATLAESLLLSDKILVNNFGPNVNLVVLKNWLGQDLLEQFLHDKTISFFHSNSSIGFADDNAAKFLKAKPGFSVFGGVGEDFSIHEGTVIILKEQTDLSDYDSQRLASLVESNNVECNCDKIASMATECINKQHGKNIDYMDHAKSLYLLGLSAQLDCSFISSKDRYTQLIDEYMGTLVDYDKAISKPFNTLLDFEDFPNLANLSIADELDFKEIYELREDKEAIKFREWLQNVNKQNDLDIIKEYTSDIYNPLYRSPKRKITSFGISTSFSIGLAFVDPTLAIPGGVAGNAFDQFIAGKILKNWSPKYFLQKIPKPKK